MDNQLEQTTYKGERVRLCTDGKYRWTWPMNMYKNPLVLLTVLKIFGIIFGVAMVLMFIGPAFRGEWSAVHTKTSSDFFPGTPHQSLSAAAFHKGKRRVIQEPGIHPSGRLFLCPGLYPKSLPQML